MKIIFTGDINFRGIDNISEEHSAQILSDVLPYVKDADFVIPNLECPLGDKEKYAPIKKSGPNLICPESGISFLKAINAYAVTVANNHIGDFGAGALKNTLRLLDENNIKHSGAGDNISEAYNAVHIEKDGAKISILSVCENEFGIATETEAGSAGYNPLLLINKIKAEKELSDFVIVVFHGGNEHNPLPSPDTVNRYRLICDMGANAVIAGHTHCPQGYEMYNGKPIIYSMGNFLFRSSGELKATNPWYYGYFTILDIDKEKTDFEIVPYKYDIMGTKVSVFTGKDKEIMLKYIDYLSDIIKNPTELKQYFKGWVLNHPWVPKLPENIDEISEYNSPGYYNLIKCEAHLSLSKQMFEILFNDEVASAREWQKKISDLAEMPV